ncbi:MAG: division/cell wall cluster transcriptional repressor MraZ [Erysipelotrichaceae bacterium]|jgi:DNA-binding transcriptional regulator/RsmH inhibitor MraZ|nr:division/cell wall cluster transcriptional repressor MraZ [Erysipelotrichaceae bacterium]
MLKGTFVVTVDGSGRIQIPKQLQASFPAHEQVYLLGVMDHLEIWDKESYENSFVKSSARLESFGVDEET